MFVYRLANALAQRGHSVDIIQCIDAYYSLEPAKPRESYPNHPNVSVHRLKSKAGILSPFLTQQTGFSFLKRKKIQQIIEGGGFDVIHFHNISLVGGPEVLEYGRATKLYTLHEYWLVCPTHVLFKFNREPCVKPSCLMCSIVYRRPPQWWRYTGMMEKALKQVDVLISPSQFTADMHTKMGLPMPVVVIPMFAPMPRDHSDETKRLEHTVNPVRPYFIFVGRLEKIKGLQDVIPIFEDYSHADLVIVGTGKYQMALENLSRGNPRIRFMGWLSYEELMALYSKTIALIVPSLCYETFGQVIIEAFSMKTPVIAKDIGALRELVTESGGGYLYQKDSALIEAMERLRTNPDLRNCLGEKGYAAYQRYWTEDQHLDRYFKLIYEIQQKKV